MEILIIFFRAGNHSERCQSVKKSTKIALLFSKMARFGCAYSNLATFADLSEFVKTLKCYKQQTERQAQKLHAGAKSTNNGH